MRPGRPGTARIRIAVTQFRPTVEGLLHGLQLEYELLTQNDGEISYSVSAPLDVRTRDISDMFHILTTNEMEVEWKREKAQIARRRPALAGEGIVVTPSVAGWKPHQNLTRVPIQ